MFHCHVLIHASFGMSMTIAYEGVSTPYVMGGGAGNVPKQRRRARAGSGKAVFGFGGAAQRLPPVR
jgi:hypothetical protein